MEPVHILLRGNGHEDRLLVNAIGKGKLAENAVDVLPTVKLLDEGDQLLLGSLLGQGILLAEEAALLTVFAFAVDVHPAGGIVAHNDHGEARLSGQTFCLLFNLLLDLRSQGLSI